MIDVLLEAEGIRELVWFCTDKAFIWNITNLHRACMEPCLSSEIPFNSYAH